MSVTEDKREFVYRIDSGDRIVFANDHWYDFARENGNTALVAGTVIGRPLWYFIGSSEARHLFTILLTKVRDARLPVTLPYRCDSPVCRRFMELSLVPHANREVEFRSRIRRQEVRERVALLTEEAERSEEWLVLCSWCKKAKLQGERWVEVEEAVQALHLFNAPRLPRLSHGICGPCSAAFCQTMEQNFPGHSSLQLPGQA